MVIERTRSALGTAVIWVGEEADEAGLRGELAKAGFEVHCVTDETGLLSACHLGYPTIALVDVGRLGEKVASICRKLAYGQDVAVMVIARPEARAERLRALAAGADDCVDPNMPAIEVAARARAILRRKAANGSRTRLTWGPISLDLLRFQAFVDGAPLRLTPAEFRVLRSLLENRGRVLTREHLLVKIHAEGEREAGGRTVDTHVYALRRKLGPYGQLIKTVRGGGYSIETPGEPSGKLPYGLATQLLHRLAAPLLVVDSDMRVLFVNESAAALLDFQLDRVPATITCRDLLGCTVDGSSPIAEADCFGLHTLALASSMPSVRYFIRSSGQPVAVEATYTYLDPTDSSRYIAILLRPDKIR